ncbi:hypothetical protein QTP86_015544 [Hemibagrus guttatus]|nr:hypothetical protein QTP86_015544 [Hemibagrus guttatus]
MNEIFRDMLHRFVVVYIDDILIYSPNLSDHVDHVKQVLHQLRHYHLYLKLEKCEFHQSTTQFLGYVISPEGIQMDCDKVEAIKSWPQPSTVKNLQCFLGAKLSPVEQNYDIGNRELLAIKLALEEWRHWLEEVNHPFEVITDHKNLQYLREAKCLNPRQAQWVLFFTPFNFCVTYHPGNKNTKADTLFRIHSPDPMPEEPEPILPPDLFVCPITWSLDDDIRAATKEEPALPGGPDGKAYVPTSLRLSLLDSVHASPGSGHPGRQRTLSLLKER